jgi:sigma-B regulation protein RsbU (phosphoserine phosphatase)
MLNKGKFIGLKKAALFGAVFEVFHSSLVVLMGSRPFNEALAVQSRTTLPRVFAMGIGMAVFSYITDNLVRERRTREEKNRIESELKVATEIQASMLPRMFPPFPHRKEFDIFATMEPAREVGGDFYDFFLIGESKLCFLIGDVSGKGVPASLFMAISKTLLKTEGLRGHSPDEMLFRVNNILCPDNDTNMFVTLFCVILDAKTGEIQFANGGHNPPLICTDGRDFEFIQMPEGFIVGAIPDMEYECKKLVLRPDDVILMYTDGVTEAMNPVDQLFSEDRLKQCLSSLKGKDIRAIIQGVRAEVEAFVRGRPQSDDITMLALKYLG